MSDWIKVTPKTMPPVGSRIWFCHLRNVYLGFYTGYDFYDQTANESWPVSWIKHYQPAVIPAPPEVK